MPRLTTIWLGYGSNQKSLEPGSCCEELKLFQVFWYFMEATGPVAYPPGAFRGLRRLLRFTNYGGRLTSLTHDMFAESQGLLRFDAASNAIREIAPGVFPADGARFQFVDLSLNPSRCFRGIHAVDGHEEKNIDVQLRRRPFQQQRGVVHTDPVPPRGTDPGSIEYPARASKLLGHAVQWERVHGTLRSAACRRRDVHLQLWRYVDLVISAHMPLQLRSSLGQRVGEHQYYLCGATGHNAPRIRSQRCVERGNSARGRCSNPKRVSFTVLRPAKRGKWHSAAHARIRGRVRRVQPRGRPGLDRKARWV